MNKIMMYFKKQLSFKGMILSKLNQDKVVGIYLLLISVFFAFLYISSTIFGNEYFNYYIWFAYFPEAIVISICVNRVLVNNYEMKWNRTHYFRIDWNFVEEYRVIALTKYLDKLNYKSPKQIEILIEMANDCESSNKFNGVFSKAFFTTGILSILGGFIQYTINNSGMEIIYENIGILMLIVFVISIMIFLFERTFEWTYKFFISSDSRIYQKIKDVLKLILLEKYKTI